MNGQKKHGRGSNAHTPGRKKKIDLEAIEEQILDIIEESELSDLDQVELPEEVRSRLEGADLNKLDIIEKELGIEGAVPSNVEPVEERKKPHSEEKKLPARDSVVIDEGVLLKPPSVEAGRPADGRCVVKVSDDRMSAFVDLYPSQQGGAPITYESVRKEIRSAGVVFGVNEDLLKKLIQSVEQPKDVKRGVIIARGRVPEEGQDGSIDYHFDDNDSVLRKKR